MTGNCHSNTATSNTALLIAARNYALRGWPVFPLHNPTSYGTKNTATCSCQNPGCQSQAKHPRTRNGFEDATTDLEQIRQWWDRWPDANIGIPTGIAFDVADIDGPNEQFHQTPHAGPIVHSSRGSHRLYLPTGAGNRAKFSDNTDWRGRGGYVVAPPSVHSSGTPYRWGDSPNDIDSVLEPVPDWLLQLLLYELHTVEKPARRSYAAITATGMPPWQSIRTPYGRAALESELDVLLAAEEGQRNDQLNTAAFSLGQLVGMEILDGDLVADLLFDAADEIGLPEHEAAKTIESGLVAGLNNPRWLE